MEMAIHEEKPPSLFTIGPEDLVDWQDAALAWAVFYRCLQRGDVDTVLGAMNDVAGRSDAFTFVTGGQMHDAFIKAVQERGTDWRPLGITTPSSSPFLYGSDIDSSRPHSN